jgi:adenosylcobinamide kinase/adenosylcobinamide-phosphate guanylyltransferase
MFITVTGGSGSGKSAFAEEQILKFPPGNRIYIATMMCFDEESRKRVARHRQMRKDKQFETLECYTDLEHAAIPYGSTVLLECMSNLTANEIFSPDGAKDQAYEAVCRGILHLKERAAHVCVVTNEIFSDGISYDMETQNYQRVLGKLNAFLAEISDACYEVVYGIPLKFR